MDVTEKKLIYESVGLDHKFVTEALSGIKEVKLYNKQNNFVDQYSKESEVFARCNTSSSIISQIPRYFVEAVAFSGIVFLIIFPEPTIQSLPCG